jgi:hypothetical protein
LQARFSYLLLYITAKVVHFPSLFLGSVVSYQPAMDKVETDPSAVAILTKSDVTNMFQRLEYLEAQLTLLAGKTKEQQMLIEALQARHHSPKELKINNPNEFKGDRLQLMNFISQCQLKFAGEPSKFSNEPIKILYTGGRLHGEAYS